MINIPFWENDFLLVGLSLIIYGHIIWLTWELLVYAELKYPIVDMPNKYRDSTFSFFSVFWPILLTLIIIVVLTLILKQLWKTFWLMVKKL